MGQDQDDVVLMPVRTVQRRLVGNAQDVSTLMLSMRDGAATDSVMEQVRRLMRERRKLAEHDDDNFHVMDTKQIAQTLSSPRLVIAGKPFQVGVPIAFRLPMQYSNPVPVEVNPTGLGPAPLPHYGAAILGAMNSTDGDFLLFRDTEGKRIGFVSLIYGNDPNGSELISDHSAEGPVAELCESFYCV
jgi:hypothetical protein